MRDFLPKCTRRDNMPLPIPANPCERTFLAVFLCEHSPACARGSDQDESHFLLPPSHRFWSTEMMRGFLLICPPCYKRQNYPTRSRKNNIGLNKKSICSRRALGEQSLSFRESTAFQDETLSSPQSGNRCCSWGMDSLYLLGETL